MQGFSRNLVLRHEVWDKDDAQLLRIFHSSQDAVVSKFLVGYERAPFFLMKIRNSAKEGNLSGDR